MFKGFPTITCVKIREGDKTIVKVKEGIGDCGGERPEDYKCLKRAGHCRGRGTGISRTLKGIVVNLGKGNGRFLKEITVWEKDSKIVNVKEY